MRLLILFLFAPMSLFAQEWQTIPHEHYNFSRFTGGYFPYKNYSQFEINPFDGSMWFLNNTTLLDYDIKRIGFDGIVTIFNSSNNPFMDDNSRYNSGIEFVNSDAYVLHRYDGVFRCDDVNWSSIASGIDGGIDISSDGDSVFVARQNLDLMSIKDGLIGFENVNVFERTRSRNGNLWGAGSPVSSIAKYLPSTSSFQLFDPSTCPLLDDSNHDFKFARNSDTLYVAGEQGFSLAFEDQFVDTITMNNSSGMPYPSILEFEFDSQDNIWAVFGDAGVGSQGFYPMYIGYYDRSTEAWSMIYDASNSPIDFTERLDIEIDLNDNLWVCDRWDLHVLKINTTPSWLSLVENEEHQSFSVFPNPSKGTFNVDLENAQDISQIVVFDLLGNEVYRSAFKSQLTLDLSSGEYVVTLLDTMNAVIGREKVVIR